MEKKGTNIYKRSDGRWEGRYIKTRTPEGKAVYGYIYGKKYSEVKAKLALQKSEYTSVAVTMENMQNFSSNLEDWLFYWVEIMKPTVQPTTYISYQGIISQHIIGPLGKQKLTDLTSRDMDLFVYKLQEKDLNPSTIQSIFRVLNAAMDQAVIAHVIDVNPCEYIVLPKIEKVETRALTLEEQWALDEVASKEKDGTGVMLAIRTGMKIEEICALRWEDVDLEENVIHIRQTLLRLPNDEKGGTKTKLVFGPPKSEKSLRDFPIAASLSEYLRTCKEQSESAYVVSCKNSFAEPRMECYRLQKMLKKAGLNHITFHTLRYTFATRCMECHADIATLSGLMGDLSMKMILDVYKDPTMEQKLAVMSIMDQSFAEVLEKSNSKTL